MRVTGEGALLGDMEDDGGREGGGEDEGDEGEKQGGGRGRDI